MLNFTLAFTYTASISIRNINRGDFSSLTTHATPAYFHYSGISECTPYTQPSWSLLSVEKKHSLCMMATSNLEQREGKQITEPATFWYHNWHTTTNKTASCLDKHSLTDCRPVRWKGWNSFFRKIIDSLLLYNHIYFSRTLSVPERKDNGKVWLFTFLNLCF